MEREEIVDACAEAAHEAWMEEKVKRLEEVFADEIRLAGREMVILRWPSESGEEQLVPWDDLSEPVREFDRIVVRAMLDVLAEKGFVDLS